MSFISCQKYLQRLTQVIALFVLLTPFVPVQELAGNLRGTRYSIDPLGWLQSCLIVLLLAWLLASLISENVQEKISARFFRLLDSSQRIALLGTMSILAILLTLSSFIIFKNSTSVIDAAVQLFQANVFAAGRFTAVAPQKIAFFVTQHLLIDDRGWYSQYPPGHSVLLAIGVLLGTPWLVGVFLSVISIWASYCFVRDVYGVRTANLSTLLFAFSPFFFFMATSYMNHVSALTFSSLFLLFFARWSRTLKCRSLVYCGLSFGALCLSRPMTGIAIAIPFSIAALMIAYQHRLYTHLIAGGLATLCVSAAGLVYNFYTTGDPFLPGYIKLWGGAHGLGFHKSPYGDVHTPALGFWNELVDIALLNRFLLEWPVPSLLPLGLLFLFPIAKRRWDYLLLAGFLAIPCCYFFYWFRGKFMGPRYMYEALVFILPLTARGILLSLESAKTTLFQIPKIFRPIRLSQLLGAVLILSVCYQLAIGFPKKIWKYYDRHDSSKTDIIAEARAQGINEGIVFITNCWGERLLANLREYGISAAMGEEAYRKVDHCLLQGLVDNYELGEIDSDQIRSQVQLWLDQGMELTNPNLNNDPTIKLRPDIPLTQSCKNEIIYDALGYTPLFPHLHLNDPEFSGSYIIARDLRNRNHELLAQHPGRKAYIYREHKFSEL